MSETAVLSPRGRSWLRMRAIARRHAYVLVRSPHRLFDVTLWPLVDVVLFGSLAAFVGFTELTRAGSMVSNQIFKPLLVFGIVGIIYFIICWPLSLYGTRLERQFAAATR